MVEVEHSLVGLRDLQGVELPVEAVLGQVNHLWSDHNEENPRTRTCFSSTETSFCPSPSISLSQTVDLPEAVPPATPIMNGVRRSEADDIFLVFGAPAIAVVALWLAEASLGRETCSACGGVLFIPTFQRQQLSIRAVVRHPCLTCAVEMLIRKN